MIESKKKIKSIIKNSKAENFKNCSYELTVGKIFLPSKGEAFDLDSKFNYQLKPSQVVLIETEESVDMPRDLYGMYTPLQSNASQGLMLVNGSLVGPSYSGRLSSYLVNLSNQKVTLTKGTKVAKLTFIKIDPDNEDEDIKKLSISDANYERSVSVAATKFSNSFVNLDGRDEKIATKVTRSIYVTVGLISLVAAFSTLKGFFKGEALLTEEIVNSQLEKKYKTLLESQRQSLDKLHRQIETLKKDNKLK